MFINYQNATRFSYLEYQIIMMALAASMCVALGITEIVIGRFHVLPLLFPGMFSVRERKFFFFSYDVTDGRHGKSIRAQAKMLIRMTVCVLLSYLWQHCVLETSQDLTYEFPTNLCRQDYDCFSSEVQYSTLFTQEFAGLNCSLLDQPDFDTRTVVTCIRFVTPSGTNWLMHLAISHSLMQLNFKCFEILVWMGGGSRSIRRIILFFIVATIILFIALFFAGVLTSFVSSWLGFVMTLSVPKFLHSVWVTGKALHSLRTEEAVKVQRSIRQNLDVAFGNIEASARAQRDVDALDTTSDPDLHPDAEIGKRLSFHSSMPIHGLRKGLSKFVSRVKHRASKARRGAGAKDEAPDDSSVESDVDTPKRHAHPDSSSEPKTPAAGTPGLDLSSDENGEPATPEAHLSVAPTSIVPESLETQQHNFTTRL